MHFYHMLPGLMQKEILKGKLQKYKSHDILFATKAYSVDFRDFGVNLGDVALEKVGLTIDLEKKKSEIRQKILLVNN